MSALRYVTRNCVRVWFRVLHPGRPEAGGTPAPLVDCVRQAGPLPAFPPLRTPYVVIPALVPSSAVGAASLVPYALAAAVVGVGGIAACVGLAAVDFGAPGAVYGQGPTPASVSVPSPPGLRPTPVPVPVVYPWPLPIPEPGTFACLLPVAVAVVVLRCCCVALKGT